MNARPRAPGGTGGTGGIPHGNGVFETVLWVDVLEFEVTLPSMLYVWDVAGAARGGEEESMAAEKETAAAIGRKCPSP